MDLNDYKHELLAAIRLGQECAKELNANYIEKMRAAYDKRNKTDSAKLPKVGDRVLVRLPRETANKQFPKLCDPWGGPYRVIETSENSALLANLNENTDPIRVQHDMLIVLPQGIDDSPLRTATKGKSRQKSNGPSKISFCFRATSNGDGDMSALGMFFKCPGRRREAGVDYEFACAVNDMVFKDVVPDADETAGELKFDNAYVLARLISIFECERNADRKRLRMRDPSYAFITLSGIEKAFTFYKRYCDHVFRCLALHDGPPIMLPHGGNSEIPIEQLNDLNAQGVKFAISHIWRDVEVKEAMQKILILLPEGFRTASSANETLELPTYQRFSEIPELVDHVEPRNIVFVGPTSRNRIHRSSWLKPSTLFSKVALRGAKVVVVVPPRGEDSWKVNRLDARDMVELAKMSAMSMRHNIVCMTPLVEPTLEPFRPLDYTLVSHGKTLTEGS